MKLTMLAFALTASALGCHDNAQPAATGADAPTAAADNTGKNERDRNTEALTPGDQGASEADRDITQQIRKSIVGNDDLSISAKNVKIIANEGIVTLRGPVKTAQEKFDIAKAVQSIQGVKRLDNQLEVAAN